VKVNGLRMGEMFLSTSLDDQSILANLLDVLRPLVDERDVVASLGKQSTDNASDSTGTHDSNSHVFRVLRYSILLSDIGLNAVRKPRQNKNATEMIFDGAVYSRIRWLCSAALTIYTPASVAMAEPMSVMN